MTMDPTPQQPPDFATELQALINRHSKENGSDTPDFILAKYLESCLHLWNSAVTEREAWYGRTPKPASPCEEDLTRRML